MTRRQMILVAAALSLMIGTLYGAPSAQAAFPGGNGLIAFSRWVAGFSHEIYVMNADGTQKTNVSNNGATDYNASWSPDGTKIAFVTDRDGNQEIYVMNADGSGQTNLSNNSAADLYPTWSPDGSKLAFYSSRNGNAEIYVMNADGSGQTRLTNNSASDFHPAWSPGGTKIVFASDRDGNAEVYVMNADGTGQTNLSNNGAVDYAPDWSPNGERITFQTDRDGNHEIYVMNADGSVPTNLTNNAAGDFVGGWSPDGSKISFTSDRDGNNEIYVMNANGTGQINVTNDAANDSEPDWQRISLYAFDGLFAPMDDRPLVNIAKAGSAIPVKFSLGGDEGLLIFENGYPASRPAALGGGAGGDVIEQTLSAGNSVLSFDSLTGRYTYIWKTEKSWAGTARTLQLKFNDGQLHEADFSFTR